MKFISTATTIGQTFKNVGRLTEILGVLVKHGFADLVYRMRLSRFLKSRGDGNAVQHLPPQVRLRMSFEELGPTFVKLGQLFATRPDLIPESFIEEFQKLQDQVATVPFPDIRAVIEAELKAPLSSIFSEFEEIPMAAASIAQVHGAVLKTGERVAVKVQRPGIERIMQNDISILKGMAALLDTYIPESRIFNPVGLVEEFFKTTLFELDFLVEANNVRRIKKNLSTLASISVPEVYSAQSTSRVLTLERFEGIRFSDRELIEAKNISTAKVIEAGCDAFFKMVMEDGIFHGDLHGGNLFILDSGRIGIIDFGIVGRLSKRVREGIMSLFIAIMDEDYETLASEYVNLCFTREEPDLNALQKDLLDNISPYVGMTLGQVNIGQVLLRSTTVATRHHLQVPRELMLLFKAIFTIEGLGKKLDPTFDILQVGNRLAKQNLHGKYGKEELIRDLWLVGREGQQLVQTMPRLSKRFLRRWSQNNFAFEVRNKDIENLKEVLERFGTGLFATSLAFGLIGVGAFFAKNAMGIRFQGVPLWGLFPILLGLSILASTVYSWRKKK